jgi:hypothetical protein
MACSSNTLGSPWPPLTVRLCIPHVSALGPYLICRVGTVRGTRRSFVFILYKSPAGAIAATGSGLKKQKIGDETVDVRRAVPKDQHQAGEVRLCTNFKTPSG